MDSEGNLIRQLIRHGDPDVLRSGLRSMGWPDSVAFEQAQAMRLGLDPAGIEESIFRLSAQYPRASPGPYHTLLGVEYGRRPSPRAEYRKRAEQRPWFDGHGNYRTDPRPNYRPDR